MSGSFYVGPHEQRLSVARDGTGIIVQTGPHTPPRGKSLSQDEAVELWAWIGSALVEGAREDLAESMRELQRGLEGSLGDSA